MRINSTQSANPLFFGLFSALLLPGSLLFFALIFDFLFQLEQKIKRYLICDQSHSSHPIHGLSAACIIHHAVAVSSMKLIYKVYILMRLRRAGDPGPGEVPAIPDRVNS